MSEPHEHEGDHPEAHSGFESVFHGYYTRTRGVFNERMREAQEFAAFRDGPRANEWRALTEEAFSIKMVDHLPGNRFSPEAMNDRKDMLKGALQKLGFAADKNDALRLYKTLGRHAHVALETLPDSPEEKLLLRPYEIEIDASGNQRIRGAKGRWHPLQAPADQALDDALGDMKLAWTTRVQDPARNKHLQAIFDKHFTEWEHSCTPVSELRTVAEQSEFSEAELLASADEKLCAKYKKQRLYDWPDLDSARHADVAAYIDEMQLGEALTKMLILRRMQAQLQPLVWQLAEEYRQQGSSMEGYSLDVDEVEDKLYDEVGEIFEQLQEIATQELSDDELYELIGDGDALMDVAKASIEDYMTHTPARGGGAAR